jgi:lipase maturation factor 1
MSLSTTWKIVAAIPGNGGFLTVSTFLRLLGGVYFIAFLSLGIQASGLLGSRGILPIETYLKLARESAGSGVYWRVPTIFWLNAGDGALSLVWITGTAAALMTVFGKWKRTALVVCLMLWLSICAVGQDFLSFQWDLLLVETGFLSIFANDSAVMVWLFRWLLFRLMFFSGLMKLASSDPVWRNLTAMSYHFETQPLPTPLAWFLHHAPMALHQAFTAATLAIELLVPFLFFAPRPWRVVGAWLAIILQLLILASGNYTFFNWLTIALALWVVIEPQARISWVSWIPAAVVALISVPLVLESFGISIPGSITVLHAAGPLRIVNSYGLFATMTTQRPEIIVEGSNDGMNWQAYEFRYKPGDPRRPPPVVAPHQPRLDWQMWFAALGTYQDNPWFTNFMVKLLEGEPDVLRLLRHNPFPSARPKYVRARSYLYHFSRRGEAEWWRTEAREMYFPPASLKAQ